MPKIVKTEKLSVSNNKDLGTNYLAIEAAAKAFAAALGTTYKTITHDGTENRKDHYVEMGIVGYDNLCVAFSSLNSKSGKIGIYNCDPSGPKIDSDENSISNSYESYTLNYFANYSTTCVIFKDSSNDSICINIHPGNSEISSDITESAYSIVNCCLFFGKDAEDSILCGIGNGHIRKIRNMNAKIEMSVATQTILSPGFFENILHTTKMVNYLSSNYSEMKGLYICVSRPSAGVKDSSYKSNASYYSDGARWGHIGFDGRLSSSNTADGLVFQLDPWIKY